MGTVLIAGCGYVGTAVGRALASAGECVYGLRRDASRLPKEICPVSASLDSPQLVRTLPSSVDSVVYAVSPGGRSFEAYRRAYVDYPRILLDALQSAGSRPRRVVLVSSTAVYGQTGGEWVTESASTAPSRRTALLVHEGERRLLQRNDRACVLRLGGIYGPGRDRLIRQVAAGSVALPEEPSAYTNRIHRDDAAGIIGHLLRQETVASIYNGVDTDPARSGDVLRWLAERMGRTVDRASGQAAAGSSDRGAGRNKRVSSERIRRSGYRFRYPTFRQGYGAMLE